MAKKRKSFPKLNWQLVVTVGGVLLLALVISQLNKKTTYQSQAAAQVTCTTGQTSNQGCNVHECDWGTERHCTCVSTNKWRCSCVPNNKCKTGPKPTKAEKPGPGQGGGGGNGGGQQSSQGLAGLRNCIENTCRSSCNPNTQNNTVVASSACITCLTSCIR